MRRREFIGSLIGTAVAWPFAVRAQQPAKVYRLASVSPTVPVKEMNEGASGTPGFAGGNQAGFKALFGELRRLGYIEGQNLVVQRYSGEGKIAHYAEVASEVVRQQPDVIFAHSTRMVRYLKAATSTIPIVGFTSDMLATGLVDSLARPSGNLTGVSDPGLEIVRKRLALLRELIPTASRVGLLVSRDLPGDWADFREVAHQAGISPVGTPLEGTDEAEYRRVFKVMTEERANALIVSDQSEHNTYSRLIIELAEESRLPAIFPYPFFAEQGGLIAYGIDTVEYYRRAAGYIVRILQGAKPSELPIDHAAKIDLIINLKTAKTLDLTVPQILLAGANELIE
jgi:putative ABC transport system substrate-binding protein